MIAYRCLFVLAGLAIGMGVADAQQNSDRDITYDMARNKVGLLRYCKQKAFLDPQVADKAIKSAMEGVGVSTLFRETSVSEKDGDKAEKNGEAGLWGAGRKPMEQLADSYVLTPAELCRRWAEEESAGGIHEVPTGRP